MERGRETCNSTRNQEVPREAALDGDRLQRRPFARQLLQQNDWNGCAMTNRRQDWHMSRNGSGKGAQHFDVSGLEIWESGCPTHTTNSKLPSTTHSDEYKTTVVKARNRAPQSLIFYIFSHFRSLTITDRPPPALPPHSSPVPCTQHSRLSSYSGSSSLIRMT